MVAAGSVASATLAVVNVSADSKIKQQGFRVLISKTLYIVTIVIQLKLNNATSCKAKEIK